MDKISDIITEMLTLVFNGKHIMLSYLVTTHLAFGQVDEDAGWIERRGRAGDM